MKILDLSAGKRAIWFNKNHPLAVYVDKRAEVNPTFVADTTALPAVVGCDYDLVVFDPPHMNLGPNSNMSKRYGHHTTAEILTLVEGTAKEANRVTKQNALMALKWNDHDIKLQRVFDLMPQWEPLFGQLVKMSGSHDKSRSQTYWVMLKKVTGYST